MTSLDDLVNFYIEDIINKDSKVDSKLKDNIWKLLHQEKLQAGSCVLPKKLALKISLETCISALPNLLRNDELNFDILLRLCHVLIELCQLYDANTYIKTLALVVNKLTLKILMTPESMSASSQLKLQLLMDQVWNLLKNDTESDIAKARVLMCVSPEIFENCVLDLVHSWLNWLKKNSGMNQPEQIKSWTTQLEEAKMLSYLFSVPSLHKSASKVLLTLIMMTSGCSYSLMQLVCLMKSCVLNIPSPVYHMPDTWTLICNRYLSS